MNDYVTKPVSPQALAEALDKWLPEGRIKQPDSNTEDLTNNPPMFQVPNLNSPYLTGRA